MIIPVGPVGQYSYFVDLVNKENISLKNVTFINMDEYMTTKTEVISADSYLSFTKFMNEEVYNKIKAELNVLQENRIVPSPKNPNHVLEVIKKHGYVDACYGGIGVNGHVAFNEPENITQKEFLNLQTRVVKIASETLVMNSLNEMDGAYYNMPKYAITIGFKEIMSSKKIRLYTFRPWHKSVIKKMAVSRPTVKFPVTLLQKHPNIKIGLIEDIKPMELK
jgi:glucosamine-6-phosphate deaminase